MVHSNDSKRLAIGCNKRLVIVDIKTQAVVTDVEGLRLVCRSGPDMFWCARLKDDQEIPAKLEGLRILPTTFKGMIPTLESSIPLAKWSNEDAVVMAHPKEPNRLICFLGANLPYGGVYGACVASDDGEFVVIESSSGRLQVWKAK